MVAVGFNPRMAMTREWFVAERRRNVWRQRLFQIMNARRCHAPREKINLQVLLRALMSVVADNVRHRLLAASIERRGAAIVRLGFGDPFVNERRADKAPSPC
jgi:hypothetical protein